MGARLRHWWKETSKPRLVIVSFLTLLSIILILIILGYIFNWGWTGLGPYISPPHPKDSDFQRGKTLWDWLQLLIIPAVLAVAGYVINLTISRGEQAATEQRAQSEREAADKRAQTEQEIAAQRYEQDQQIALDKQREDLLQVYLDRMSELLLKEQLRSSAVDAEVRNVARVRTITILFQLDARRIGYVFAFLREAGLMSTTPNDSIVSLKDADLANINFSQANLFEADLFEADLWQANLSNANLYKANLSGAILYRANLSEAYLSGADLSNAKLGEADLSNAVVTEEQLKKASSLEHAIMPDGSKYP